jgi:tetratricopeptide (TPR) repeat protein
MMRRSTQRIRAILGITVIAAAGPRLSAAQELRISRSPAKLNPAVMTGFKAFKAGDYAAADIAYAQALNAEPANPDALHGAAAVALRRNERDRAEGFYQRALDADPRDAFAQAGLAGLRGHLGPTAESRLKLLIVAQPDQPSLQFALGNLYAASGRWHDAQQAFFNAHSAAPDQPDYLFNLAVSLDHLRQTALARRFYERALAAAERLPAAFERQQATARLLKLEP